MNNGMAVRAHRHKVLNWVNLMAFTDVRKRRFVMHVN